jgi:hypothetical protein
MSIIMEVTGANHAPVPIPMVGNLWLGARRSAHTYNSRSFKMVTKVYRYKWSKIQEEGFHLLHN